MRAYLTAAVATVLIVTCGLVNAYWTGWIGGALESQVLDDYSRRIDQVPYEIGDWHGKDLAEMDPREKIIAGAQGSLTRQYVNQRTNQSLTVSLVCGHSRNIAQHTPNQCYVAAGFQMLKAEQKYDIPTDVGPAECYTAVFKKEDSSGMQYLRVFWTWSFDGEWSAPDKPRYTLRNKPALFKLYFICEATENVSIEQTPSVEFARVFVPTINKILFPEQSTAPADTPIENAFEPAASAPEATPAAAPIAP